MSRPSHVRNGVFALILESDRHDWSAEDILTALTESGVSADFSSVCRGLAYLERDGTIRKVNLGDGKTRYEAHHDHHDHIRCEGCGSVAAIPGCVVEGTRQPVEAATGYVITGHSLLFSGLCRCCAQEMREL